jgi:hypothetical protein
VKAYSAKDGKLAWTFYTVPGPGEVGHDTWPQDSDVWKYGGASVWQTPAVDPELGLVYFSTSNPGPVLNGNLRAGEKLFSASVVAIDAATVPCHSYRDSRSHCGRGDRSSLTSVGEAARIGVRAVTNLSICAGVVIAPSSSVKRGWSTPDRMCCQRYARSTSASIC